MKFGLPETTLASIREVLARHPAVQEAVVFGSRALGREHARSDVDIALRGPLPTLEAEGIALELEELPVAVQFDVQRLDAIHHRGLREHIARVGQVLYSRESSTAQPTGLPTAKDINVHNSLDEQHACEIFLGKSVEEAEALFHENALSYHEDLMWMGPVAFRFYVEAAIRYIRSEAASGDSDAISGFAGVLEFRLAHGRVELAPIAATIASACDFIIQHYESFGLAPEIYGDIRARFQGIQQMLSKVASLHTYR